MFFCVASLLLSRRRHLPRGPIYLGLLPLLWTVLAGVIAIHLVANLGRHPLTPGPWIGLSGVAWACAFLPAVPVALCPLRWRWRCAAVVGLGLAVFGLGDVLYLRFFGTIVPPEAVRTAHQVLDLGGVVRDLLERADILWILVAGAAFVVGWPQRQVRLPKKGGRLLYWAASLAVLAMAAPAVAGVQEDLSKPRSRVQPDMFRQLRDGFLRAHLFELSRVWDDRAKRQPLSTEDHEEILKLTRRRAEESAALPFFGAARGHNVLMIQVEALAHWVVDAEVDGRAVTPFLRELAENSRFYPRILDQTSDGRTSDAEYLVLNSLHPLPRGAVAYVHVGNRFVALPGLLQDQGYSTFSAHAFRRGFWNRSRTHPAYGFERSYFRQELGQGEEISWGLADHLFLERTTGLLKESQKPYFAFLVTLSTHRPFEVLPPSHDRFPLGHLEGSTLGRYLQVFHYVDRSLKNFFERLEEEGLLEETLVVLYGDHTESGFDRPRLRQLVGIPEEAHEAAGFTFVPLFFRLPQGELRRQLGGRVPQAGGLLDIGPTVLHLLGQERPGSFLGRPLVPGAAHRASRWRWDLAVGDERLFVESDFKGSKCKNLADWSWRPRVDCREIKWEGIEERRLSLLITTHDLAPAL